MRTWHIVLVVGLCILGMLTVIGVTLLVIDRKTTGPTKEELLVSQVQGKYPQSTNWPADTIVKIAKDTCGSLDRGATMGDTINAVALRYPAGAEADYDLIAFTMVTGIQELCPQHIDKAREFSNGR